MRNKNENIAQQLVPPLIPMVISCVLFTFSGVGRRAHPYPPFSCSSHLASEGKSKSSGGPLAAAHRRLARHYIDGKRGTKQKPAPRTEPDPDGPDPHPRQRVDRSAGRAGQAGRQGRAGKQDRGGQGKAGQAGGQASK